MVSLRAVRILHGPGNGLHAPSFAVWCRTASAQWGVDVTVEIREDWAGLASALDSALAEDATAVLVLAADAGEAVLDAACTAPRGRLIWLELEAVDGPPDPRLASAGVQTVRGRGVDGHRWALRSLLEQAAWPATVVRYGTGRDQACDLRVPDGAGPWPVAVLVHGGAWGPQWERDLMDPLAVDLARRGYATWNIEYRRLGEGGGWPETFSDVAGAFDTLADVDASLDLDRVAIVGHSAGGHLAHWLAARRQFPAGAVGADPAVEPAFVLSLAGLPDLVDAARRGAYDRAAERLIGGAPADVPERYAIGSPDRWLPLGVPQLLVHGTDDQPDNVDMNRVFAERAAAVGDDVTLVELPGVEHFAIIEPRSVAWRAIAGELERLFPA